jgi:hypothetical protein
MSPMKAGGRGEKKKKNSTASGFYKGGIGSG